MTEVRHNMFVKYETVVLNLLLGYFLKNLWMNGYLLPRLGISIELYSDKYLQQRLC